jgi:hypothetical protein
MAGQLSKKQAFSATHLGIRILPYSTGVIADGDTNAVMAELWNNLSTCFIEPSLAGKNNVGSFSLPSFFDTWRVPPAAGAVGVPQGIAFAEGWRRFMVPYKVPENTLFGATIFQGSQANWSTNVKDVFAIQVIYRGVFARAT